MSLITRCPACGTMFKVVPDQLRISEGWVRCGHCSEVFDAAAHLQQPGPPAAADAAAPPEVAPPPAPAGATGGGTATDASPLSGPDGFGAAPLAAAGFLKAEDASAAGLRPAWQPPLAPAAPDTVDADAEPAAASAPATAQTDAARTPSDPPAGAGAGRADAAGAPAAETEAAAAGSGMPDAAGAEGARTASAPAEGAETLTTESWAAVPAGAHGPEAVPADGATAVELPAPPAAAPAAASDTDLGDLSFVRTAQRRAFWQRRSVRAGIGLMACVLLLLLAQVALHERDRLAVLEPRSRGLLAALCEPLGCRIAPLRQIEAFVIESSSFNKVRGDTYRLGIAIRNRSAIPLAMPGVELTLTDAQGQPVLRRVLSTAELGAGTVLRAGAEWSASLPVAVATGNGNGNRIVGYHLDVFYP